MTVAVGTLEQLALFAGKALAPLKDKLAAGNLAGLFNELGLAIPLETSFAAAINTAAQQVADAAADLPDLVSDLVDAIEAENVPAILAKGAATIVKVKAVVQAADTLASGLPGGLTAAGVTGPDAATFAAEFSTRLVGLSLVQHLETEHPALLGTLELGGIFERPRAPKLGGGSYIARSMRLDRLSAFLTQPKTAFTTLYQWGQPDFKSDEVLRRLADLGRGLGVTVGLDDSAVPPVLKTFGATVTTSGAPPSLLLRLNESIPAGAEIKRPLAGKTSFVAKAAGALTGGLEAEVGPSGDISTAGAAGLDARVRAGVVREAEPDGWLTILALAGVTGIRARQIGVEAGADLAWNAAGGRAEGEVAVSGDIRGGQAFIDLSKSDGFVRSLLGNVKFECNFDLGFDWSISKGLRLRGSSALTLKLPLHIPLGPAQINGLNIGLGIKDDAFPLSVGADIAASLGILDLVVEDIGLVATISFPPGGGDIGPVKLDFGFKPPVGAGISVDTGTLKGGGYLRFDPDAGEYIGALELSFQGIIDLKAFGIINTKLPGGEDGFAFLILITAEFVPIQLGFGFTLVGVGGLLSLNRTLDVAALSTGVRTGALNSILFPQDVVANIGRIASDIKTVFPLAKGHFIVAPMGKLGWGTPTLISLELGIILDIPEPQIVLVGVLRISLPAEDAPLIKLQVNFAGGIDFEEGLIWFDAALFDSRLILFTLEGEMALRIGWGDRPLLIISVGGFHPAFRDVPEDLKGMKRITLSLLAGDNPRITVQTYFAITSNTVQSGARVELYASAAGFNIYGFLGYDLLIQFNPLHFVADLNAGLALRHGTSVIAGISVNAQLSGPAPWHAHGDASLDLFFFDITVSFSETWGLEAHAEPVETEKVLEMVQKAIADDRNWRAIIPANSTAGVSVRAPAAADPPLIVHPFAVLSVSQKVAPLGFRLERFGEKKPDVDLFEMTTSLGGVEPEKEEFAIANFKGLTDSEKLTAPSFERMRSGVRFSTGDATEAGARVTIEVDYELSYIYRNLGRILRVGAHRLFEGIFNILAAGSAASRNAFSKNRNGAGIPPAPVAIKPAGFAIVDVDTLSPVAGFESASSYAEARAQQDSLVASDALLTGKLQVVALDELDLAA